MGDSFPLPCGRHHFFPRRSFNAALSSMASARSRFSRVFSSSSVLSRLASETSMPPYLAFQGNKLWGDGWVWSWFDKGNPLKTTSTDYKVDCHSCHVPAQATEWVYVQGYPALKQ